MRQPLHRRARGDQGTVDAIADRAVHALDVLDAVEMVDLVKQHPGEHLVSLETSPPEPTTFNDRQPSGRSARPRTPTITGFTRTCGAHCSIPWTSTRTPAPTWFAARPIPDASFIVRSIRSDSGTRSANSPAKVAAGRCSTGVPTGTTPTFENCVTTSSGHSSPGTPQAGPSVSRGPAAARTARACPSLRFAGLNRLPHAQLYRNPNARPSAENIQ